MTNKVAQNTLNSLLGAIALIAVATLLRLLPHPPGFSPIAAVALFGAAVIDRKALALAIPLIAMFLSDLALGFHDQMPAVYGAIILIELLGFSLLRSRRSGVRIVGSALGSSVIFFVVTNLSVWAFSSMYAKTVAGLIACFTMALPFFENALAGDLVFTVAIFAVWALAQKALEARSVSI